ncbi:16S rRNA (cytosine(1402)-N(4))-methyltransferase RsmH [Fluviicola taffensis]|uniref:Ribosomal RNA small subunit methyltransferase H n=1 Tax=Fluviicola taffensis (strain DSM 16823 / NCIMB 13979 / RW262) TaxID=755732 RepID=F2IAN7_FLUTR|nr:16S rRNA (cytosine(1402)-N(4))-methyltransferase RsmH [Fluviicola taffensis]AEA44192.1 Ribosomal RNA small subunit methyltransferase H [Fluviicola taffensis DSM 16823]
MTNNDATYHVPVMLQECLDGLVINPDGIYVDVTFGGGGHSRAIFEKLSPKGKLIVFDQDPDARANAWEAPNFHFVAANFAFLRNHLRVMGIPAVDGILADLGVSSHQFDDAKRGFSIRSNEVLDMRMNQAGDFTAAKIVQTYDEEQLAAIFRKYGELDHPFKTAVELVKARNKSKIKTTGELMEALMPVAPKFKDHKFFAQVFQALRIEVNQEMDVLEKFLLQTADSLKPDGRLVVMSYHSLEDRLVKNLMKRGSLDGSIEKDFFGKVLKPFEEINRKPILPSEEEIQRNTRARSAKLRIAKRVEDGK